MNVSVQPCQFELLILNVYIVLFSSLSTTHSFVKNTQNTSSCNVAYVHYVIRLRSEMFEGVQKLLTGIKNITPFFGVTLWFSTEESLI